MNIHYIRSGDYYIPDLTLPEETRSIGKWGRMHREYLREHKLIQYYRLLLSGKLWTYLADLNQQARFPVYQFRRSEMSVYFFTLKPERT